MSVVNARGLSVAYGAQDVFSDVDVTIAHGDRIGLVGPNGEGKTSLLRVLGGMQPATAGTVHRQRGLRIGYLPQVPPPPGELTVVDEMLTVFAELRRQQSELRRLETAMADPQRSEAALERYSRLQVEFEAAGGYTYELRVQQVLNGLGFDEEEAHQPLSQLSGGQRTRALLARLLLEQPDLLLLDEPTNHLDLEALEWLEGTLLKWPGSMVVVAHDRYFLDKVATRIWDLTFGRLEAYRGNYSHYVQQRESRQERLQKEWQAQQEHIAKTEDFIQRYMAGQRSKQAKGRLKRLERFKRDEAIERPRENKHIRLDISTETRSGNIVLRTKGLVVGFPDDSHQPADDAHQWPDTRGSAQSSRGLSSWRQQGGEQGGGDPSACVLFHSPDLEVLRGQRVALIGPNGSGKTTFLRTILDEVPPLVGRVQLGGSVDPGYLSQMHAHLDSDKSVLDTILDQQNMPMVEARGFLGRFLFTGDDVFKRVGDLSGGERSRVALACLTLREANFLLLDEPTNHLDVASQEILEEVIRDFPGTVLLVSHDRYLVDRLATHVWVLRDGALHTYKGGYQAYLKAREEEVALETAVVEATTAADEDWRERAREERRRRREEERRAEQILRMEQEIAEQEARLAALAQQVTDASQAQDVVRVAELGVTYREAEAHLERLLEAWGELA